MRDTGVVIVAGGTGSRAAGSSGELKQFRWVAGKPMLLHSVQQFQAHPSVALVVCVLPRGHVADPPPWLFQCDTDRLLICAGGQDRENSVRNGLEDLPSELHLVLIHDAARPFVPADVINRVIAGARAGYATIPVLPVIDTTKLLDDAGDVVETLDRNRIVRAQTPQGFPRDMIISAHANAMRIGLRATDDATLCEAMGVRVRAIEGSELAMKITAPWDFDIADALARRHGL
jgi:2-C-methyl-D-erythritol 4-phosphate cytidylyltransferase